MYVGNNNQLYEQIPEYITQLKQFLNYLLHIKYNYLSMCLLNIIYGSNDMYQ